MKSVKTILALSVLVMAECPQIKFSVDTLDVGTLDQGAIREYKVQYQNLSKESVAFSELFAQGKGPKDLKWTEKLAPAATGELSFKLNTQSLYGGIREHISLQGPNICLYPLALKGEITPALMFTPAQLNLGSLKEGDQKSFQVYAWDPRGSSQIELDPVIAKYFETQVQSVNLQFADEEHVREVAKGHPAWRIQLKLKTLPETQGGRKSIGLILPIKNLAFPSAESGIYAVGWKGN